MGVIAAAVKHMLAAGMDSAAVVAAIEAMEATPTRTLRQERNRRYYEKNKASEKRLNASEQDELDVSDADKRKAPPDPPKENTPSSSLRFDEGAASAPLDSRTLLFRDGLRTLADISGRPETKLRSLIGKWLRDCDDDALRVLNVIAKAKQDRPVHPVEWIEKHFQPKPQGNGHVRQTGSQQGLDELRRRASEREAARGGDSFAGATIDASYQRRN